MRIFYKIDANPQPMDIDYSVFSIGYQKTLNTEYSIANNQIKKTDKQCHPQPMDIDYSVFSIEYQKTLNTEYSIANNQIKKIDKQCHPLLLTFNF